MNPDKSIQQALSDLESKAATARDEYPHLLDSPEDVQTLRNYLNGIMADASRIIGELNEQETAFYLAQECDDND